MKHKKFEFKNSKQPTYIFEKVERVFWSVALFVSAMVIFYNIGRFFGWLI